MGKESINLLLIGENSHRVALLRQALEARGLDYLLRRIDPGRGAVAYARQTGPHRKVERPDLILFDYSEPNPGTISLLKSLTLGRKRATAPVVIMTSPTTEPLLEEANDHCDESMMFSPTNLASFIDKMSEHKRPRFLRAMSVMYDLGPIPVRLPSYFLRSPEDLPALSA